MKEQYLGITIDTDYDQFDEFPLELLKKHYLRPGETSPQHAFARAATNFCYGDYEFAQRMYEYVAKQYASFASPIISNAVNGTWTELCSNWDNNDQDYRKSIFTSESGPGAMPISCFLTYVPDDRYGQVEAASELAHLSMLGGGVGQYMGMRGITSKSPGAVPYIKTIDSNILYYHQAGTRRGSVAVYLDIHHSDLVEYIGIRNPSGGDINRKSLNVHIAVNITDDFLDACDNDLDWSLINPHTKEVTETIKARNIWQQILETRFKTGEPYIHYIDESNRKLNPSLKERGLTIKSSNLCVTGDTEIDVRCGIDGITTIMTMGSFVNLYIKSDSDETFYVRSRNITNNTDEWNLITNAALTEYADRYLIISTENSHVKCTENHPLYDYDEGDYTRADFLSVGDTIIYNGKPEAITDIQYVEEPDQIPVYDITVENTHNFYANGILVSNCSEITLAVDKDHTAICCLSSLNAEKYDEWKDTTIVEDFTRFLDNVVQWFIDYAPDVVHKAVRSASTSRDIGIGLMGWHNFLMSKRIPFESGGINSAMQYAYQISKTIHDRSLVATKQLANERGEPEYLKGSGLRNAHRIAIAPNANSAIIAQTSASVEPINANIYTHRTRVGSYVIKNKYLDKLIIEKGLDYDNIWKSILANDGSIQHLDEFTDEDKKIFKTANEIDQRYVIDQARIRQEFIDQASSLNLFFREGTSKKELNMIHRRAFSRDPALPGVPLKTLYYLRSTKKSKIENVSSKIVRNALKDYETQASENECIACQA